MKNGHVVKKADRARIKCGCGKPAHFCGYSRWTMADRSATQGIAFYYYCPECWGALGPQGTSPAQRAHETVEPQPAKVNGVTYPHRD